MLYWIFQTKLAIKELNEKRIESHIPILASQAFLTLLNEKRIESTPLFHILRPI